jgi:hypothetical protein
LVEEENYMPFMQAVMLEDYGRLVRGRRMPVTNAGRDWIGSGGYIIPRNLVALPAEPGTRRAKLIEDGTIITPSYVEPNNRGD